MTDTTPYSEFHQYPELTDSQKDILQAIGLALFSVQGVEMKLKFLLSFVFPECEDATLRELYDADRKPSKVTLGKLISKLGEQAEVTSEFEAMLRSFLEHRNRFVHGLLVEKGFNLGTDEGIRNLREFLNQIGFECWHINAVLMGYIVTLARSLGIADDTIPQDSVYVQNLHKYFSPEMMFKERATERPDRT